MTYFRCADAEIRIAIQHARQDHISEEPRRTPWMGRRARDHTVSPHILITGEVRRLVKKAMVHQRKVEFTHGGPYGLEIRMINRKALSQMHPHGCSPFLFAPHSYFGRGPRRVGSRN